MALCMNRINTVRTMNKLITVLVAGLFATSVFAQAGAPAAPAAIKAEDKAAKTKAAADVKTDKAKAAGAK